MKRIRQPGPLSPSRIEAVPCEIAPLAVTLKAGPLGASVTEAVAEFDTAWLTLGDAPVERLSYLFPAEAPDPSHAAWYAGPRRFGPGRIGRLGLVAGRQAAGWFLHGHGDWWPLGGPPHAGHILAEDTILTRDTPATGLGVTGARFERRPDPETNFELFSPAGGREGSGALVRIRPNEDFPTALDAVCAALGWEAARAHGLGSVIGADFEDGRVLESYATEMLVLDALVFADGRARPGPEILITGMDGVTVMEGRLVSGENPVLITAEILLERL